MAFFTLGLGDQTNRGRKRQNRPITVHVFGAGNVVPFLGVHVRRRLMRNTPERTASDAIREFEIKERRRQFEQAKRIWLGSRRRTKTSTSALETKDGNNCDDECDED